MSIKITYIYSACIVIETPDVRICCDPWFTDGAFDGSWYLYPPIEDPIALIGKVDYIWISHIHPDHYDPVFLHKYLEVYPETRILISNFKQNFLQKKMIADGFDSEILPESFLAIGQSRVYGIPREDGSISDVDAALVVQYVELEINGSDKNKIHTVVNMNDCQYDAKLISRINAIAPNPDIALIAYASAGPYPQTYYENELHRMSVAEDKKRDMIERHLELRNAINPKITIPFAGLYVLGGKNWHLNKYRAVPDACDVPGGVVLWESGSIDTETLKPDFMRMSPLNPDEMERFCESLQYKEYDYEAFPDLEYPIKRLMSKAYINAKAKSELHEDYYFCIKYKNEWLTINATRLLLQDDPNYMYQVLPSVKHLEPRSEITVDPRYLFGLLTGFFHWNNAEIGSMYMTHRVPDVHNRAAQNFLNFLVV